jgi:hypothetical protein
MTIGIKIFDNDLKGVVLATSILGIPSAKCVRLHRPARVREITTAHASQNLGPD